MPTSSKSWFITGASSGFGLSLTRKLLARGDRLIVTVRKPDSMAELKQQYGEMLTVHLLDVADGGKVAEVIGAAFAAGRIDVVVSNAGYGLFGALEEVTDEQIRRQLDTNLLGSVRVIKGAIPFLREQGGGRILQLSSMGGQAAFPGLGLYHATKWGIEGVVESLFSELAPFNIQLTLVEPGGARTRFGSSSADVASPVDVYEQGRIGQMRRAVAAGISQAVGDPDKMADAMIVCAEQDNPPRRLALGSDAYTIVHAALTARLAELEAGEAIAKSTDFAA